MKFRRLVIILILAAVVVCYFTKPTKEDFINYIQPGISKTGIPPVVDYKDNFLYAKITALYVDAQNPVTINGREVAGARKEEYIGFFKKFWKQDQ